MNNPWLANWRSRRVQARHQWQSLERRERRMLVGAAGLLGGLFAWLLLIEPALDKIAYWQLETPKLRSQAAALDTVLRDVAAPPAGQSLARSLQQSLDAGGLAGHYQLQAVDGAWQLTFDAAPADALISWLLGNPQQFFLEVVEARLQRAGETPADDAAGMLSGTVRMDQAQGAKENAS